MREILLLALIIAYAGVNVVSLIAYWPTIRDLYFHKKPSANITSYILWTITTGVTLLYALFILPDLLFRIGAVISFGACATILILTVRLKK